MKLEFFLTDADYIVRNAKPCIRLYGRSPEGKSAIVLDSTFSPYFYVVPQSDISAADFTKLKEKVEGLRVAGAPEGISDETENGGSDSVPVGEDISPDRVEIAEKIIGIQKRSVLKVFARLPAHIPHLKTASRDIKPQSMIENIFEYDIPFYKRYLFDRHLLPAGLAVAEGREIPAEENRERLGYDADIIIDAASVSPAKKPAVLDGSRILAFDLESIEEEKRMKIIMASAASPGFSKVISYQKNDTEHEVHVFSEKELIAKLFELMRSRDPDFIATYNGDAFDFVLLESRAKELKEKIILGRDRGQLKFQKKGRIKAATIRGRPHIDLYNFVARVMSPAMSSETLSLDSVATELLGEGKRELSWDAMKEYWQKKYKLGELAEYCLQDSRLTLKLARRIMPNIFALSEITSQIPSDTSRMTYGQLVENYAIKKASELDIIVPNRPTSEEISGRKEMEQYTGGFVKEPKAGMHENIAVFDFRGLYPSIIVTHNIDPATLNCECCKKDAKNLVPQKNYYFCSKRKGFIPQILEELINERKRLRAEMKLVLRASEAYSGLDARQYAVKTVSNAMYGYLGFAGSRWYRRECAEGVAAFGRHYIHNVIGMAEKEGLEVLYGDSITADRFVTIRNKDGIVEIKNIEELFLNNAGSAKVFGGKERIGLIGCDALTLNPYTKEPEWKKINQIMRHKTHKKVFRVSQKYGETVVTEDHSLITDNNGVLEETKPLDMSDKKFVAVRKIPKLKKIKSLDFYKLLSKYSNRTIYKKREKVSVIQKAGNWLSFSWTNRKNPVKIKQIMRGDSKEFEALCRLTGAYISEGSSSTIETTNTRFGASIASSDIAWLEQLKKDYLSIFKNAKACIIRSTKKKRTLNYKNCSDNKTVEY